MKIQKNGNEQKIIKKILVIQFTCNFSCSICSSWDFIHQTKHGWMWFFTKELVFKNCTEKFDKIVSKRKWSKFYGNSITVLKFKFMHSVRILCQSRQWRRINAPLKIWGGAAISLVQHCWSHWFMTFQNSHYFSAFREKNSRFNVNKSPSKLSCVQTSKNVFIIEWSYEMILFGLKFYLILLPE